MGSGNRSNLIGPSDQLLLNKFFDSTIPSMRTSKIQNGHQGASKWPTGSGKGSNPRLLGVPVNFCEISFLIRALLVFRPIRGLEIQNGRQGAPKWPTGSGKGSNPRLLGAPVNFCQICFLIRALCL